MKQILFPTDFTASSNNAFLYALHIAQKLGAGITTLHVYENLAIAAAHMRNTLQTIMEENYLTDFEDYRAAASSLNDIAEKAGYGDVVLNHIFRPGEDIKRSIITVAKEEVPYMIVMSSSEKTALESFFKGRVAGEVLENADRPVLVVPPSAKFDGKLSDITFATNYAALEKVALERVLDLSDATGASTHVVSLNFGKKDACVDHKKDWEEHFSAHKNLTFIDCAVTNSLDSLINYLGEHSMDALCMVVKKRSVIQELFNATLTKKLVYSIDYPILAIQDHTIKA